MARPFPTRLFLFAFLGWTFDFYDLMLFSFIKDGVAAELHLSHNAESWLLGVALSTSGIGGIVSGILADRFGKRPMLALTVLIYSLGSLVCGLAPNLPIFLAGRGLVGLGVGGEWAIGHGLIAEAVESKYRGRAAALLQSGEPVGVALAAVIGYLVMPVVGWRAVLIGSSATALLALFMRRSMRLPTEPDRKRRHALVKLYRASIGKHMLMAWILVVLKLGTYWTCYIWLPGFLLKDMGQGIGKSTAWVLTAQIGQFLGMLTFGSFADRYGRRPAYSVYSLLTAAALGMLAFRWQWLSLHPPIFWFTMLTLGFGAGCTAGFGALLSELFPTEVRSAAMGTTYNLGRAVQLVAPVAVAAMAQYKGLSGALSVPLLLALATAMWVWVLPETRGIVLPRLFMSPRSRSGSHPRVGTPSGSHARVSSPSGSHAFVAGQSAASQSGNHPRAPSPSPSQSGEFPGKPS